MARILIVDDDETTRLTMGAALEQAGHEVGYAPNGDFAVQAHIKQPFDALLIDLVLPGKSGLLTIRELKEIDAGARIIAMSGLAPEDLDLAEEYGAMRTAVKPIEPAELLQLINSVLRRSMGWDDVAGTV